MRLKIFIVCLLSAVVMAGCSSFNRLITITKVYQGNELVQHDMTAEYAKVYFIRPNTEHPMGYADNSLDVAVGGERLMELGKGEYTLVYLKPRKMSITLTTLAQVRGRWELEKEARSRAFEFENGKVYYIYAEMIDGEFRGTRFVPKEVDLLEARELTKDIRAVGMAVSAPIS